MAKKRVFIIHGWKGDPAEGWFPWLKKQLEDRDFEVYVPAMPDPDKPKLEVWISYISNLVGQPDKDTYFIGHSSGCRAILSYLEKLPEDTKIGGAIFVAGWFMLTNLESDEDWETVKPWLEQLINFDKVKVHTKNFVAVFSENDPYVPMDNRTIFEEGLGCKIIMVGQRGHLGGDDGIIELSRVLEEILNMAKTK